ncbi:MULTISPECIES: hypothetical protein [unclassified Herbaspirillum]|uniref:hypothetical protein n=1 Tax=unclassified Herbaspirillum TaxID=2624150 RepID=UPI0010724669|nr:MULTISPECIES: hypothetical protein [unclassified Herbaspirillum]TFI05469.1 hypothetical protein E4P32_20250 [Herbaspirillum sp. 3R11]TFI24620.1 hypothetical protein E4P30_15160 [Herbaspirillum sp. 3C11]
MVIAAPAAKKIDLHESATDVIRREAENNHLRQSAADGARSFFFSSFRLPFLLLFLSSFLLSFLFFLLQSTGETCASLLFLVVNDMLICAARHGVGARNMHRHPG